MTKTGMHSLTLSCSEMGLDSSMHRATEFFGGAAKFDAQSVIASLRVSQRNDGGTDLRECLSE